MKDTFDCLDDLRQELNREFAPIGFTYELSSILFALEMAINRDQHLILKQGNELLRFQLEESVRRMKETNARDTDDTETEKA